MTERVFKTIKHNRTIYDVVKIDGSYYVRQGTSLTGPYSDAIQAEEFIRNIQP